MASQDMTVYKNPIIPGFAPDPSVVNVNGYFFLVTSSFHVFPGIPIYISQDLNNWTHLGNAISRLDQLDLSHATTDLFLLDTGFTMVGTSGIFAPTIRYHKGTFYIICTNTVKKDEEFETFNFYITTNDIWSGQWSDPIFIDFNGIDPSLFFDEDDRVYLQGSWRLDRTTQPSCTIKQYEIDIKTGKAISKCREIWPGFAKYDSEGPHIYKKDGWYYLVIAEGGTFEHHMLSVARSPGIWGPFESYENNPILTADGKAEYIQNTGHGELFEDDEGHWWAAVLGVRDDDGRQPLGRETFLTPVYWPNDGWPRIEQPQMHFERHSLLKKTLEPIKVDSQAEYVFLRIPIPENYKLVGEDQILKLSASEADLSVQTGSATFLGKRQRMLESFAIATLHTKSELVGQNLRAGLALYKDPLRHVEIYVDYQQSQVGLSIETKLNGKPSVTAVPLEISDRTVDFKIRASRQSYEFLYRIGGGSWDSVGAIDSVEMTGRDFTGTIFGIFASGTGESAGTWVSFEGFEEVDNSSE